MTSLHGVAQALGLLNQPGARLVGKECSSGLLLGDSFETLGNSCAAHTGTDKAAQRAEGCGF